MYFQNFRLGKTWSDKYLKTPVSTTCFDSQKVKGSQTLWKSAQPNFYHIFHNSETNLVLKCLP